MLGASFVLSAWIALNVWATLRVRSVAPQLHKPGLLTVGIWLWPVFGALVALNHARAYVVSARLAAPSSPCGPLEMESGPGAPEWLDPVKQWLGPQFRFHVEADVVVLSALEPRDALAAAGYIAKTRKQVERVLGDLARFPADQPSVLIVFDDQEDYYAYVSRFYPDEGEFAFSSGMFIGGEHAHFVIGRDELSRIEPVVAHELTHSALAHLQLPLWLDEGIAVNTERRLCGMGASEFTAQELHVMHRRFWNTERIQEFWSGRSFQRVDEGNQLSYDLARIIVEQTGRDWAAFTRFAGNAERGDAGVAAAARFLELDLVRYVSEIVGLSDGPVTV